MNVLTIGKLAKKAGVTIDTVRFYERCGLIKEPARTQSNYRVYPEEEVAHLRFVKKAKELGFSLNEIKQLIKLQNDPQGFHVRRQGVDRNKDPRDPEPN